jgi:hypothetical protein
MTKLITMGDVGEACEMDDRLCDVRGIRRALAEADVEVRLKLTGLDYDETVDREIGPGVIAALEAYYDEIIAELERDIRKLGIEPSPEPPRGAK